MGRYPERDEGAGRMHLVDFQAQSHVPKMILNGFCFMTVNVQMYYETEQNVV